MDYDSVVNKYQFKVQLHMLLYFVNLIRAYLTQDPNLLLD